MTALGGAGEQLTPLDATFLELEQLDTCAHMHIGGVMTFEPQPEGGAPRVDDVRRVVGGRLAAMHRYRQRLSTPTTSGLRWPTWEPDPSFDLAAHVRRVRLPGRGSDEDLREWASDYYSNRLDRSRPLWELVVISGLEGGRWALASKTHHCMIDGVGSVDAALVMLDGERHPQQAPAEPLKPLKPLEPAAGTGSPPSSAWDRIPGAPLLRLPLRAASTLLAVGRSGADVALHPGHAREATRRSRALVEVLIRSELIPAPKTSLNVPIGGTRRVETVEVPLETLKRIKRRLGGTVNDVILAAIAGGLRELLLARGEALPQGGLRAMVPVNIRAAGDQLAIGNRITSLFVPLAVAEGDVWQRYRRQMEDAESLKAGDQALGTRAVIDLTGYAPPILHGMIARTLYATRLFNLTITNVPGPQFPLYAFGSKLLSVWPIVPLAAEHALGIAIFSYDGRTFITANADRDSTHDIDVLMAAIATAIDELERLRT